MMTAALGTNPGVGLGPSSKFPCTHRLAKRKKLRRGAPDTCNNSEWRWRNTEMISTFPGPNWPKSTLPTCWKEKARKDLLGTESECAQKVWAHRGHLRCEHQPSRRWLWEKPLPPSLVRDVLTGHTKELGSEMLHTQHSPTSQLSSDKISLQWAW